MFRFSLTRSDSESSSRALFFVSTLVSEWPFIWMDLAVLRDDCEGNLILSLKSLAAFRLGVVVPSAKCVRVSYRRLIKVMLYLVKQLEYPYHSQTHTLHTKAFLHARCYWVACFLRRFMRVKTGLEFCWKCCQKWKK